MSPGSPVLLGAVGDPVSVCWELGKLSAEDGTGQDWNHRKEIHIIPPSQNIFLVFKIFSHSQRHREGSPQEKKRLYFGLQMDLPLPESFVLPELGHFPYMMSLWQEAQSVSFLLQVYQLQVAIYFLFYSFLPHLTVWGFPDQGLNLSHLQRKHQSPNHWTTNDVLTGGNLNERGKWEKRQWSWNSTSEEKMEIVL